MPSPSSQLDFIDNINLALGEDDCPIRNVFIEEPEGTNMNLLNEFIDAFVEMSDQARGIESLWWVAICS